MGSGTINQGFSPGALVAAVEASADDNNGCYLTSDTCNGMVWARQRRTHILSNGSIIWDLAGNTWEPVIEPSIENFGGDVYIGSMTDVNHPYIGNLGGFSGTARFLFGPLGDYSASGGTYAGLGFGYVGPVGGAILRGGATNDGVGAGVFATNKYGGPTDTASVVGFRCVKTYQ